MTVDTVMEARRVLGYAAIGLMISAPVAASAREGVLDVYCTGEAQQTARALDALNRGFMPAPEMCRDAQRELQALMEKLRNQQYERPRA